MAKISPNFNEAVTFSPNVPGSYICEIKSAEVRYAQSSGNPYIAWKLGTVPNDRIVFYNTPVVGKGANMFKHFVHSAGDTGYNEGEYDTDKVIGAYVFMKLSVDENKYFKVIEVSPVPAGMPVPERKVVAPSDFDREGDIPF